VTSNILTELVHNALDLAEVTLAHSSGIIGFNTPV